MECLKENRFQFIGTDCHNMHDRSPNMGEATRITRSAGLTEQFSGFQDRLYEIFNSIALTKIQRLG